MIENVKEFRVKIDSICQLIENSFIKNNLGSRYVSLSFTELQTAKMWLGRVLKELGNTNPYPDSKNPANEKIEPTADTFSSERQADFIEQWGGFTRIQKIKYLRLELEKIESALKYEGAFEFWPRNHYVDSIKSIILSGMWLGMELQRINEEGVPPEVTVNLK